MSSTTTLTITSHQKRPAANHHATLAAKKQKTVITLAECDVNQPLLDALDDLAAAMATQTRFRYQAAQIRKVVAALADLKTPITSGTALASGKQKIKGLGKTTAAYMDDFLSTGTISAIQEIKNNKTSSNSKKETPTKTNSKKNKSSNNNQAETIQIDDDNATGNIIHINRAPILALWATVVSQRQGYTREEALTHAKWIQVVTARAKGKSLGKFGGGGGGNNQGGNNNDSTTTKDTSVNVWSRMNIPVESSVAGRRFAVMSDGAIDAAAMERYLKKALGHDLERIQETFWKLANSMDPISLRKQAFDLYVEIRPDWQGWGKAGKMDLDKVCALVDLNSKK
ncbi:expressed unknown protein [Seminavis robusta]|uniref:Crossover junction endonuclease MUS81-like HHH domain-containing protein n=1 Tax=Seminavis robusta TaxID=568900 RepID=A0A9N8H6F5_9STRA|nr:expressed unknown protein [Seminavis robusta]|eukprot:Sro98_g050640.1 n/a (341) ;mRNA; f:107690-108712